ncbi:MAG: chemotaxis protein CheB [Solirubrobacteraceae bacterium]|nr:chemotaxis protein CheB [Solirubrobacteraceae bacterium]
MSMQFDGIERRVSPSMVVGVGASAGGVEALCALVGALPESFGGSMIVVLHTSSKGIGTLVNVLGRAGALHVEMATDRTVLRRQTIYVAPHDRQLVLTGRLIRLTDDPPQHGYRPAIDATFASLASFHGLAAGVLLSGTLSDGTRGLLVLKAAGGTALVQDPAEAQHAGMIRSAQRAVAIDATLPVLGLAARLVKSSLDLDTRQPAV